MTIAEQVGAATPGASREVLALRSLHQVITRISAAEALTDVLDTVTRGVVDVLGFRMAVVEVLDSSGWLEAMAVVGDHDGEEAMLSRRIPLSEYTKEFEIADEWGLLRFVPHERLPDDVKSSWIPSMEPLDHPDAWHPLDALHAPLHGPDGVLLGVLGVDVPEDGMRPGPMKRTVLEMYAVQAGLAIHQAQERERLREGVRLAEATRLVVRAASRDLDLEHVLRDSRAPLLAGFGCDRLWIRAIATTDDEPVHLAGDPLPWPVDELDCLAAELWERRVATTIADPDALASADGEPLDPRSSSSRLVAPIGAGPDCLGALVMERSGGRPPWSDAEREAALQVGHELGRAVANARLYARERALVTELRELDRYKGELMGTITHELKNPLAAILGHVELLEDAAVAPRSVGTIRRNADRMQSLVEDLLVLASVQDARRSPSDEDVDLAVLVAEVCDEHTVSAAQRQVLLGAASEPGAVVRGGPEELRRLVGNLVSNAVKYSRPGGRVDVSVATTSGEVVLRCTDTGIGIADSDLPTLFDEFDRSSNPAAREQPGNGLGLAIVRRIADRHDATIEVASGLGAGTAFTVTIPRAAPTA